MGLGFYKELLPKVELPHESISLSIFLVVEKALCAAWDSLRTSPRPGFDLLKALEDEVTIELRDRLLNSIFDKGVVSGFDRWLFLEFLDGPLQQLANPVGLVTTKGHQTILTAEK